MLTSTKLLGRTLDKETNASFRNYSQLPRHIPIKEA